MKLSIKPFKVNEVVKRNSANYYDFIDKTFFAWYNSQSCSFKMKCEFMYDNAQYHVSKYTHEFFEHKSFTEEIMEWPPSRTDLNPIENQWSIVKMKLYEGSKQYNSKADLWEVTMSETEPAEVKK